VLNGFKGTAVIDGSGIVPPKLMVACDHLPRIAGTGLAIAALLSITDFIENADQSPSATRHLTGTILRTPTRRTAAAAAAFT
jgi:hypothetical protein